MKRDQWIGLFTVTLWATLAISVVNESGPAVSRADNPPPAAADRPARRQAALARQQARKQQIQAARAQRQAQRALASQAEAQIDAMIAAGLNPWNSSSTPSGWGSNWGSSGGFPGTNPFGMSSGGTTAAGGSTGTAGNLAGGGSAAPGGSTGGTATSPGVGQDTQSLSAKVLEFALNHLGQQVGNGECWTLAEDALLYAGAKPAVGYVFGEKISLDSAQPGDILQFESAVFVGPTYWMQMGFPHHTAIVDAVQGSQFVILQQNFNGIRRVQMSPLNMADLRSGTVTAYRAVTNGTN
jgi:hypothetical protein